MAIPLSSVKCVLALMLQTSFVLGTIKSIGVYLPELTATLKLTSTDVGVAIGLFNGFSFGPGPIVAYIYQRCQRGYRRLLLMTGALLAPGALIVASQVTNKIGLSLALAAAGLGSNIMSICLVIILNDHNTGSFNLLYGIGKSGYAFGMSLVPLAAACLMDIYGWTGSMMIIGGFMANLIPLTLLINTNSGKAITEDNDPSTKVSEDDGYRGNDSTVYGDGDSGKKLLEDGGNMNQELETSNDNDAPSEEAPFSVSEISHIRALGKTLLRTPSRQEDDPTNFDKLQGDDEEDRVSLLHSPKDHDRNINQGTKSKYNLCELGNSFCGQLKDSVCSRDKLHCDYNEDTVSLIHNPREHDNGNSIQGTKSQCNLRELGKIVCRQVKDSVYNRDRWLILLMLITFAFAMMDAGWHAFLVPRAVGRGWSNNKALYMAYSGAVAAFLGRCFGGVLLRFKLLSGRSWFLLLTLLNIASLTVDILSESFTLSLLTSFITSLTIAERNILVLVICKDRVNHSEFPVILASSEVVFGIGAFVGVSLSGFFKDVYGTFNASFIFIAAVDVVVFCLTLPLLICNRKSGSHNHDNGR